MAVLKSIVLAQALLWSLTSADASNLNPKGEGCVDPSGYLQCYEDNDNALTKCLANAKENCDGDSYSTCVLACGNVQLGANIGCWLTSCWNQVYSCAYQETALQYFDGTGLEQASQVPYYPAPDNAPGGCVCNLGYIWGNYSENYALNAPCLNYASDGSVSETANCQCCYDSSYLSEIIEECPHNDLSVIAIDIMLEVFEAGYNESASNQCEILSDGSQCVTSFSLDTVASTWYNPGQLPSGFPGTIPLSDTTDAGSITSSPDPYTFSIFPSYITVITPAPYNKKNVAATQTGTTDGSATGTTATGTAATGTSTSLPSKGAASSFVGSASSGFGFWGLAMYTITCALFGATLFL